MCSEVSTSDLVAAAEDAGVVVNQADLFHEEDMDINEDACQLVCAKDYLFMSGVPWEKIRKMESKKILESYNLALQRDALIIGV